ncbi:Protein maelstrom like protein [Argiope bruennichi]|uniref:Protein maelstrom like protein n=1 Tax=Argiope bruennichi TaxID=94029 RepID=A0A8T0EWZ2_ARGBR|nr:Protein maelstrom like protein [Argiope bruennichi]
MPNSTPLWVNLSSEEKERYEELARQFKHNPGVRSGKMAGDGTLVEDNFREMEEEERRINRMKQEIKRYIYIDCVSQEQFKEFTSRKMFYFISFNILCQTETSYIPIEVGMVEYSISYGIHREMHMLIHPGPIPTGYTGQAKRFSDDLHHIDIFKGEESSERNMSKVFDAIQRFVNPSDEENPPPLFCIGEDIEKNKGCLEWLANKARDFNNFQIWNAGFLLLELRAGVDARLPSEFIANDLLTKTCFDYHSCARCNFHDEKDTPHCALAYCKRLCYLLSDAVCPVFDVVLTERHIPTRAVEEKAYVVIEEDEPGWTTIHSRRHLDKRRNYYENKEEEVSYSGAAHRLPPAPPRQPAKPPAGPRQPTSVCLAEDMSRMNLDMASAPVPGQGIGRGRRWK